jgi:hypothetical protein
VNKEKARQDKQIDETKLNEDKKKYIFGPIKLFVIVQNWVDMM